jgi:Integrase core domain
MAMGIRDRPISPRSPWQNGHMERLIGTIRRECLDRMLIFGEAHLRQILTSYVSYYNESRTHLSLRRICRSVERSNDTETLPLRPFCRGCIIATRGYDFRKGQDVKRGGAVKNAMSRIGQGLSLSRGAAIRIMADYGRSFPMAHQRTSVRFQFAARKDWAGAGAWCEE